MLGKARDPRSNQAVETGSLDAVRLGYLRSKAGSREDAGATIGPGPEPILELSDLEILPLREINKGVLALQNEKQYLYHGSGVYFLCSRYMLMLSR